MLHADIARHPAIAASQSEVLLEWWAERARNPAKGRRLCLLARRVSLLLPVLFGYWTCICATSSLGWIVVAMTAFLFPPPQAILKAWGLSLLRPRADWPNLKVLLSSEEVKPDNPALLDLYLCGVRGRDLMALRMIPVGVISHGERRLLMHALPVSLAACFGMMCYAWFHSPEVARWAWAPGVLHPAGPWPLDWARWLGGPFFAMKAPTLGGTLLTLFGTWGVWSLACCMAVTFEPSALSGAGFFLDWEHVKKQLKRQVPTAEVIRGLGIALIGCPFVVASGVGLLYLSLKSGVASQLLVGALGLIGTYVWWRRVPLERAARYSQLREFRQTSRKGEAAWMERMHETWEKSLSA